jgi:hypothetical protein
MQYDKPTSGKCEFYLYCRTDFPDNSFMLTEMKNILNLKGGNNMNTLELTPAGQATQPNSEAEVISTASISVELAEAREEKRTHKTYSLAFNVISSILLILIGILILKVTGLYDGIDSTAGKIILCTVTSYCYLIAFRRGLYSG